MKGAGHVLKLKLKRGVWFAMTVIQMNKRDQLVSESDTWLVDGCLVYEAVDGKVCTGAQPYNLSSVFNNGSSVSEDEVVQYLVQIGFPWTANFE